MTFTDTAPWFAALVERAGKEPLGIDISDFSDEFCDGFLAGQVNALEHQARLCADNPCACEQTCGDSDPDGQGVCKGLPRAPEPPLVDIVLVPRSVLGRCPHGVDLDRDFCLKGCRV